MWSRSSAQCASKISKLILCGLAALGVDEVLQGRERLRHLLPGRTDDVRTISGWLDGVTLGWSRLISSDWLRLRFGSRTLHLIQSNVFDHLWFLWFLGWFVVVFAALAATAVLLVAGLATLNDRLLATVLQPAYAWTMSLAMIGLFCRLFPHPRPAVSWLADASYWMYLVHVPLVMIAQLLMREWPLPAGVKFLIILTAVTAILLASYRWCVRYTVIGTLLNGPRAVPTNGPGRQ